MNVIQPSGAGMVRGNEQVQKVIVAYRPLNLWQRFLQGWVAVQLKDWCLSFIALLVGLMITACDLPQVSAEERLFLNLSLDFLSEYQLPKLSFQDTPIG
ncbi:MAG: hypothetical protein ACP5RH_20380, partial [Leptodesmis sp.]